MTKYLLDTNVISELRKPVNKRDVKFNEWLKEVDESNAFLSVLTVAEIERGIILLERKDKKQANAIRAWFNHSVLKDYESRIIPLLIDSARIAMRLRVPDPPSKVDAYIAATALTENLTLATRNVKDFIDLGVRIVNPWEPNITSVTFICDRIADYE